MRIVPSWRASREVTMSNFFEQLQAFSERVFEDLGFNETTSPWQSDAYKGGSPIGAILHFTAGSSIRRALRWFMQQHHQAKASANVVVADGWPEEWIELAEGLDLVQALPAAVVQCVPPDRPSWHATWTNRMCYGIEMVNAGVLKRLGQDQWAWWPDNWTRPWQAMGAVPKDPTPMYGRYWEPYTPEQILAVVEVLRQVQKFHGTLKRYMVLGHEQVTEHKFDPGPLFPIHGVRLAIYEDIDPTVYRWFERFNMDYCDGKSWRDDLVVGWWREVMGNLGMGATEAWFALGQVLRSQFLKSRSGFGILGKVAMQLLGYYVGDPLSPTLGVDEERGVEVFQKMMKLKVDGIPGVQTKAALVSRLEERGILGRERG